MWKVLKSIKNLRKKWSVFLLPRGNHQYFGLFIFPLFRGRSLRCVCVCVCVCVYKTFLLKRHRLFNLNLVLWTQYYRISPSYVVKMFANMFFFFFSGLKIAFSTTCFLRLKSKPPWWGFSLSIYLFILAMLGLHCCSGFSQIVASSGSSLVVVRGLLTAMPFLVVHHRL